MIYLIMTTLIILGIVYFLVGTYNLSEDNKNKNAKDNSNTGGDGPADSVDSKPASECGTRTADELAEHNANVPVVRKTTTKRRVQPSTNRTGKTTPKKVVRKSTVKKVPSKKATITRGNKNKA